MTLYQVYAKTTKEDAKGGEIYIDADGTLKKYTGGDVAYIHEAPRSILHGT